MHSIFGTMRDYHMIEEGMRVIAGVSGGADSVCLLYALCEYRKEVPFELIVVHVEHGLRGEESLSDARFTQELCGRFEVPCHIVHAQVEQLARTEGISVEEAGRRERYRIFRERKEAYGAHRIAVAHNRSDQAETVLWNLARGSGLRGLGGMSPVRDDIIRPLLFTGRDRIEQILTEAGIPWHTDRTNLQQDYTRNRIRLSILPQMEQELNGRAVEHIAAASDRLRKVQEYLDRVAAQVGQSCIRREADSVCIELKIFLQQDVLIQEELLKRAVAMCGGLRDFGSIHLQELLRLCGLDCGKELSLPGRLRAVREDGIVRLRAMQEGDILRSTVGLEESEISAHLAGAEDTAFSREIAVKIPGDFQFGHWRGRAEFIDNSPELSRQIVEKKYTKWISCDTITNNVLLFRTRRPGDYLVVNAEGGRKKLKDYLIDLKVPRDQRDDIWLLAEGSHILWVVGYRISEAVKVTADTGRVLKVQVEERVHEGEDKDFTDGAGGQ